MCFQLHFLEPKTYQSLGLHFSMINKMILKVLLSYLKKCRRYVDWKIYINYQNKSSRYSINMSGTSIPICTIMYNCDLSLWPFALIIYTKPLFDEHNLLAVRNLYYYFCTIDVFNILQFRIIIALYESHKLSNR